MGKQRLSIVVAAGMMTLMMAAARAADDDCSPATLGEAKAMALKAASQVESLGPAQAFRNFMDPDGEFFEHDLYVFVVDFNGTMLVNGAYPQSIGSSALSAEDRKGRRYIAEILRIAQERGEGWIEYEWLNPCTGEIGQKNTFFKRVGSFIVAVGAYGGLTERPKPKPKLGLGIA